MVRGPSMPARDQETIGRGVPMVPSARAAFGQCAHNSASPEAVVRGTARPPLIRLRRSHKWMASRLRVSRGVTIGEMQGRWVTYRIGGSAKRHSRRRYLRIVHIRAGSDLYRFRQRRAGYKMIACSSSFLDYSPDVVDSRWPSILTADGISLIKCSSDTLNHYTLSIGSKCA